jgi:hypothetical protein
MRVIRKPENNCSRWVYDELRRLAAANQALVT